MKNFLFISVFFISIASAAAECLELVGTYDCTFETTGPQRLEIAQQEVNGVTAYYFNNNEAIADGKIHRLPNNEEIKDGFYKATCSLTELAVWQKADLTFANGHLEVFCPSNPRTIVPKV